MESWLEFCNVFFFSERRFKKRGTNLLDGYNVVLAWANTLHFENSRGVITRRGETMLGKADDRLFFMFEKFDMGERENC